MTTIHVQKIGSAPIDQQLLNQAVGFYNAASRCFANIAITPRIQNSPMTPGIVCAAFSVELYLKLLNFIVSGKAPRGHKLDELFAPLPADVKSALGQKYAFGTLETNIAQMSSAFVEWRYEHEHEALQINPDALMGLAAACHLQVREMNANLKVFGENQTV